MKELILKMRGKNPLAHQLVNQVVVEACANITLAIGASPIMAEEISEMEEIVDKADSLLLNIGTVNQKKLEGMICAGKRARQIGLPSILDPVGVGVSNFRQVAVQEILDQVQPRVIKGNGAEISYLLGRASAGKGVDGGEDFHLKNEARNFAKKHKVVVAATGRVDFITDGEKAFEIHSGHPALEKITGTGCMTGSLIASFLALTTPLEATVLGIGLMARVGELAAEKGLHQGLGSFRTEIFNGISQGEKIQRKELKIEEV